MKTSICATAFFAALHTLCAHAADPAIVSSEFIFESAPFAQCHASTLVETPAGLVAAWFGGTAEGNPDVTIWSARKVSGATWSAPVSVADGVQPDGTRRPAWNPVLFLPKSGPLLLFYKVGPSPSTWWGLLKTSIDEGKTWSEASRIAAPAVGPIKNKPIQLANGDILSPSSSEDHGWRVHFERSRDNGQSWEVIGPIHDGVQIAAIQPSLLFHKDGALQAVGRTKQGHVFSTESSDAGQSWSAPTLLDLPNPNSGTDALTLADGRHLLVYNHTPKGRSPLNVALSEDGQHWQPALTLESEPGEYSYPAVIQSRDGLVHISYTWKRKLIRHVVLDPKRLNPES